MKSIEQRIHELATSLKIEVDIDHFIDYHINENNEKVLTFYDSEYMEFPNINGDVSFLEQFEEIEVVEFEIDQVINFSSFKNCHSLQGIIIDLGTVNINEAICLPNLKTLCLLNSTHTNTTSFDFITRFPNLERLIYNPNDTHKINALERLTKLKFLSLSHGIFSSLDIISKLTHLEQLHLHQCKNITDFSSLKKLVKLTHLSVYGCNFNDISVLSALRNLEILTLNSNKIQDINVLKSIPTLKVINASNNNIKSIEPIIDLPDLVTINFMGNQITNIPLLKSSKLVYVYFSDNLITSIENLAVNSSLQHLYINNNHVKKITRLPKNLLLLQANNNPIEELLIETHQHLITIHCENHSIKKLENFSINSKILKSVNLKHKDSSFLLSEAFAEKSHFQKKMYCLFKIQGDYLFKKRLFDQAYKTYEKSVLLKTIASCRKIEQQLLEDTFQNFYTLSLHIDTFMQIKEDRNRIYDLVGNKKVLENTSELIALKIRDSHLEEAKKQELNYKLLYKIYPHKTHENTTIHTQTPAKKSKNDRFIRNVERIFWIIGIGSFIAILLTILKIVLVI